MATPAAVRIAERELLLYRRIWRENVIGAFVQPFLYLVGVGVGVGSLIDDGGDRAAILGETSYFAFYATALLATTTMFNTSQEALWPTMDGFRWSNAFRGMIGTPLEPRDLATAFLLTFGGRALVTSGGVACVLALFPSTRSLGLFGAVPAAVLCGLAFAMPIAAWTGSRDVDNTFPAILRFVVMPMFLFGGAFYPVEQLPPRARGHRMVHAVVARHRTVPRARARWSRHGLRRRPRQRSRELHRRRLARLHNRVRPETSPMSRMHAMRRCP